MKILLFKILKYREKRFQISQGDIPRPSSGDRRLFSKCSLLLQILMKPLRFTHDWLLGQHYLLGYVFAMVTH